nr:unnamed protein product [Spirometra erinaceieuropaei]
MFERFYRQLKASLRAAADPENWTDHLPPVLLGIRSALKPDLGCSAAELSSLSPSYLEKDLATGCHVHLRCNRVRRPLEPPYDGPFRVLSRGPKTSRIQRGNSEDVVSVVRLKAAVPGTPPDEPCGPLLSASPHAASIPPSRISPLPSCPLPLTATTNTNTSSIRCVHSSRDPVYITRSGRHVHSPDRLITDVF